MRCRQLTALILVCAYLLLPLDALARHYCSAATPHQTASAVEISAATDLSTQAPCAGHHHADGCNSCSCCSCCSFFAPSPSAIPCNPTVTPLLLSEPFQRFPQVYLPIFVPPQNIS